jgi:hypothetical protein
MPKVSKPYALRKGQITILRTLYKWDGPMTRAKISEQAPIDLGAVSQLMGKVDGVPNYHQEHMGVRTLIELGYVELLPIDVDGLLENNYVLTQKGREAYLKIKE